ncbi:ATP-binding cassette domain-containing protein [Motiliproteus sp. MSK22-1]|uniref:ATP-binding cassette domain-containing protein n=1 Tax=Motiliproteus sp. MSK22-1 TaxID=1897630 RepID=UPI00097555E5|nr:ATP-binding cassette domain-containing protein [Motiliproteus sp. MSK22-1]OMH33800.1 hypothetical protein BGP75_12485 [Motiliproteus sp. MSK22-1]
MLSIDKLKIRLDDWSSEYQLQVADAEILAIQGKSGVGKSTLLHAIAGFVSCQSGSIAWQGKSIENQPAEQRPVSLLFQDHNLFEHLSITQNLKLGFGKPPPWQKITAAAKQLEIEQLLDSKPGNCSGGQRQRVALIRTLLRPEPIVLLDEPFAELDPQTRGLATDWVRQTAKEGHKTLLLVTHQDEDVERVADRCLVLNQATDN